MHWEGTPGAENHADCASVWEAVKDYHERIGNGTGTAYNHGYCRHSGIFEGKGWGFIDSAGRVCYANGTTEANKTHYAICYMHGPGDPFTDDGKRAALTLLAQVPDAPDVQPHRHFFNTQCPGDDIIGWIDAGLPAPGPTLQGDDVVFYKARNTSTINPAVTEGTIWLHAGTRFLKTEPGDVPAGAVVVTVNGDEIGIVSAEMTKLQAAADKVLGGGGATADEILDAMSQRLQS